MKVKPIYKILIGIILLMIIWFIPLPDMIAFRIGLSNSFKGEAVGFLGKKPLQYKRFALLDNFSSTKKLKRLYYNHISPAVKCYSFYALRERVDNDELFILLSDGLKDDRELTTQFGCIIDRSMVADVLIDLSREYLSDMHNSELDSLILYSHIDSRSQNWLLRTLTPNPNYYLRIRELATEKMKPEALIALSKFQQDEDILIIKQQLNNPNIDPYYPLLAVKHFPAEDFTTDILRIQSEMIRKHWDINHPAVRVLYKAMIRFDYINIKTRLTELITLDRETMTLPDNERTLNNLVADINLTETDASSKILEIIENDINKQTVRTHMRALSLALYDYPKSKYKFLIDEITLDQTEMLFLEMELEQTIYE